MMTMTDGWNSKEFAEKMNCLLKRYYAGDNGLSPAAVELRAVWRAAGLAYAIFTVSNPKGIAYVGLEMTVLPGPGSAMSEEETAIEGWLDRLGGDTLASTLDYNEDDKIQWKGKVADNTPEFFSELGPAVGEVFFPTAGRTGEMHAGFRWDEDQQKTIMSGDVPPN